MLAEFEGRKTGLEKNHMEFAREREQELLNMRQVVDRESKMRLEQNREVCDALRLDFSSFNVSIIRTLALKPTSTSQQYTHPFPFFSSSRASVARSRPRRAR